MYDVLIIGAGPGGIFTAYELMEKRPDLKIAVFEMGNELKKRKCPIDGDKIKSCIHCKSCSIMSGFGGAGAFSDGKYNITNDFGGTLHEYICLLYTSQSFLRFLCWSSFIEKEPEKEKRARRSRGRNPRQKGGGGVETMEKPAGKLVFSAGKRDSASISGSGNHCAGRVRSDLLLQRLYH